CRCRAAPSFFPARRCTAADAARPPQVLAVVSMKEPTLKSVALLAGIGLLPASPAFAAVVIVDSGKSQLTFSGVQSGAPFQGRFSKFEAHITFDPAKPEVGHATVLIDM